jgi:2-hydroxycyclohexanecarboxyl-CoA dehydrogenase
MTGRVALVTGAAAGIGRAIARRLAADGLAVGVLDLSLDKAEAVAAEIRAEGGQAIALQADVSKRVQVLAAVDQLRGAFGPVTVAVNNAGISIFVPFEELTDEQWDQMLEINLKSAFIVSQICFADMKAANWGRIVNISSSSAQTGAVTLAHYSASKGGMISMTRTLAQELGPYGVTVNNVPPGSVMNTIMSEANKERFPIPYDQLIKNMPVRRMGEPEDIANAVSWLCKEESGYVTGQTIGVNGGRIVS